MRDNFVLVHAGLEGPRSTFARRFTTVHDKRDVCSCHETRKPSPRPCCWPILDADWILSLSLLPPAPPARLARSWRVRPEPESRSRRRSTQRCPAGLETRDRLAGGQVDIPRRRITCRWRRATTSTHALTSLIAMHRDSYPSPTRRRSGWPGRCRRSGEPGAHRPHNVLRKSLLLLPTNHVNSTSTRLAHC